MGDTRVMQADSIDSRALRAFREGAVIPALPLALTEQRTLDERHQKAVIRYYIDAGAGGIAVGVHSTQFEIRDPSVALFRPVLELAARTIDEWSQRRERRILKIAGAVGRTVQAVREAELALAAGYDACLVGLSALPLAAEPELVDHCRAIARVIPILGFYLQPAVGGRLLSRSFWRRFAEIENVIGIKIAPFNRYQTLDVVRGVCEARAEGRITLYTGNDDNLLVDLLTPYRIPTEDGVREVRIAGGLLGQWGVWTSRAVELLGRVHEITRSGSSIPQEMLGLSIEITDANAALFDAAHAFAGVIPGIHEVLRRQGLFRGIWCLDPGLTLSPGQADEIDRACSAYPHLTDNGFVRQNLAEWLDG